MNQIPEEFQLKEKINHTDYLINGEINSWNGKQTNVYSTLLCDSDEKEPDLIGYTPEMSGECFKSFKRSTRCFQLWTR